MHKQNGSSVLVLLGVILAIAGVIAASYITNYNYGNRTERAIEAAHLDNQNVLSNYSTRIMEMAQVPTMYKNDVLEVFTAAMEGRYGENGSQAMFQWLQEQNPQLDASLYGRVQQSMEAGRNEFRAAQTRLIDLKRSYETSLGNFYGGFWLSMAGYPKIDLDDYNVVTSTYSNEAFESGVDNGLTLRP